MATLIPRTWLLLYLHMALLGRLESAGLRSGPVSSLVGTQVVLPCSWRPSLGSRSLSVFHVQWSLESLGPVLEQSGSRRWLSPDFEDRAQVPESELESGDCSLIIQDVQVTDAGQYDSYMILDQDQDQTKAKTGIFIQSVKLLVFEHTSVEFKRPGEALVLDLPSPRSMTLVFQDRNSSDWVRLWQRGTEAPERLQKDPLRERLTLKNLTPFDQGTYKVLDVNGLTMSSTRLTLDQHESTALKFTQFEEYLVPRGDAVKHASSLLLVLSSFLVRFL